MGKYVPGVRIPILDEAKTKPPDAYLILAWNFLKEFLAKEGLHHGRRRVHRADSPAAGD